MTIQPRQICLVAHDIDRSLTICAPLGINSCYVDPGVKVSV